MMIMNDDLTLLMLFFYTTYSVARLKGKGSHLSKGVKGRRTKKEGKGGNKGE